MTSLFLSSTTGNVFERTNGNQFSRIGFMDIIGDYEERDGIGATFSPEFIISGVKTGFLIPMVRLIGGGVMVKAEYVDVMVHRAERA